MDRSSFSGESANLDLIRAVAVLCVLFGHLRDHFLSIHSLWAWRFAQMGVLIFFVHTSFVLMLSLERSKYQGRALFWTFYLRRFFRLYPLSILVVTIVYLHSRGEWSLHEYLINAALIFDLTYTRPMWGVMWTLVLEMQMYVVLPFLFLFCGKRSLPWLFGIWLAVLPIAYAQPFVSGRLDVLGYVPSFMGGVIAWRLSREYQRQLRAFVWPFAVAAVALIWLSTSRESQVFHRWFFGMGLGLAIPFFRELTFRPLVRMSHEVAKYSYGIYLTHPAAIVFAFSLHVPLGAQWIAFVLFATISPVVLYHLVEKPMIDFGQRITARLFRQRITASAPQLAG